jgi:uncharacterized DUF497 family protein
MPGVLRNFHYVSAAGWADRAAAMPPTVFYVREYRFDRFTWPPGKREINLAGHGFDFHKAAEIFSGKVLVTRSDRFGEVRWLAVGPLDAELVAVAFVIEVPACHILSIRKARRYEREMYLDRIRTPRR